MQSRQQSQTIGLSQNRLNELRHALKCCTDRISLNDLRLSERYVQQEIHIILQFRYGNSQQYVALFQGENTSARRNINATQIVRRPARITDVIALDHLHALRWQEPVTRKLPIDRQEEAMFVDIVQPMELPEDMACTTSVWFDSVDGIYSILPHSLYFSGTFGFVFRGRLADGKVSTGERSWLSRADSHQMVGEMVKHTTEVLKGIASDQGNNRGNVLSHCEIVAALPFISIILEQNRALRRN